MEIDINVDSGAFTGISHHGQICSIAALPTVKMVSTDGFLYSIFVVLFGLRFMSIDKVNTLSRLAANCSPSGAF